MNEEESNKRIKSKIEKIMGIYLAVFLAFMLLISLYINMTSFQKQYVSSELSFYSNNRLAREKTYSLREMKERDIPHLSQWPHPENFASIQSLKRRLQRKKKRDVFWW